MPQDTTRTADEIEAELASLPLPHELDSADDSDGGEQLELFHDDIPQSQLKAEAEATRKGWVPKDKYKGEASRWVDAKTFLDRGEKFNSNLQREVADLRAKLEAFEGTRKQFVKFHEETLAAKEKQYQDSITQLRIQKSQATADGDHEVAIQIEDRIDLLKEEKAALKAAGADAKTQSIDPTAAPADPMQNLVVQEWVEDGNEWFRDDLQLRDYAVKVADELIRTGETKRGRKFLDLVRATMEEEFPRRFKASAAGKPAPRTGSVEGGAASSASSRPNGSKSERDLPPEDLALMRQFIKEGWTTKQKFLDSYFSRNP